MRMAAARLSDRYAWSHPQWWLGLMLLALHGALAWGILDWWPRAFMLAHFGLFLLWQPVFRGEREIQPMQAVIVLGVAMLFVWAHSWWLIAMWLAVLFGLIGGSVPRIADRRHRLISIFAALYLLSILLMWVVPHLFTGAVIQTGHVMLVRYVLPVLAVAIVLMRASPRPHTPVGVDLFYSVLLFLLVVALVLGSFVVREVSQGHYVIALAQTLFGIAVVLLALSWLWYPRSGFAGIGHLLSSYLMSLGMPFERWVQQLASLADEEREPQRFLTQALQHMCDMPWLRGVQWQAQFGEGACGTRTIHATPITAGDFTFTMYTRWEVSPAMLLHLKLLAHMVEHFYEAKRREQAQRQNAYTQAIYETGARLTHDVKNLLQSLKGLCAAAASSTPQQAAALALIQRQLPQITQRLNTTLDKLQAPQQGRTSEVDAALWWDKLVQRYAARGIEFAVDGDPRGLSVPAEVFDTVADNLIENACNKAAAGNVHVHVHFSVKDGGTLQVCDTGAPVPQRTALQLFTGPVPSQRGLGVGIYQSGKLAEQSGYELLLVSNQIGDVSFSLRRRSKEDRLRVAVPLPSCD
jgi:hypothetical protein